MTIINGDTGHSGQGRRPRAAGTAVTRSATQPDVGDFATEVDSALDNVEAVLRVGGATLEDVVKVNAYLSNATLFAPFNELYARRIGAVPPARTTVVVDFGHPDVRVEIEAIAYLGERN